jgi:hypothetical protein
LDIYISFHKTENKIVLYKKAPISPKSFYSFKDITQLRSKPALVFIGFFDNVELKKKGSLSPFHPVGSLFTLFFAKINKKIKTNVNFVIF